ncbi:MAG: tRNA (adenosine(37)-N6)-threonylcarbamoyltransferase complex ATPase subunit type 1 TsaE [Candidatus Marinimicrobia bacterium]|nr:tRNA (adenosine(37)-N6)-threonylcarbamoyltransferase complex ATPase subunit type 1 TsaE [Candidatus Neomarinimicrobiota bacterium]
MEEPKKYHLHSLEETQKFAASLAKKLPTGTIVALIGNLGSGKTTFTQGFAKGLGVKDAIGSPTFKLVSQYDGENSVLYHIDCYRLKNSSDFLNIGGEMYLIPEDGYTLIEWADIIEDILPEEALRLQFDRIPGKSEERMIAIMGHSL